MKKTKKILALALAAVMLVCTTVAATLAYLQDDDVVTNTFTVGEVGIELLEAKVDLYGVEDTAADRVKANTYKLIPGHTYVKDPEITVDADSENCYLFVKITNGIDAIEVAAADGNTMVEQMTAKGWELVGTNVYMLKTVKTAGDVVPVFDTFTVADNAVLTDSEGNALYSANTPIIVEAYAIQADGFDATKSEDITAMLVALGIN